MKNNIAFDRWFLVHMGAILIAAMVAVACLGERAEAQEQFSVFEPGEEVQMPQSVPMGFGGFDHDVLLGSELEALEEFEDSDVDSSEDETPRDATAWAVPPTPSSGT